MKSRSRYRLLKSGRQVMISGHSDRQPPLHARGTFEGERYLDEHFQQQDRPMRPSYLEALKRTDALNLLARYNPRVAGTLPLGLATPGSDIDILCHAEHLDSFARDLWSAFGEYADFRIWQWVSDGRPVVASFTAFGWPFEIFGDKTPTEQQRAWRHFDVERRLLELGGDEFRAIVAAERAKGTKTEPAFALVLGLSGDPYEAILDLTSHSDEQLLSAITRCASRGWRASA